MKYLVKTDERIFEVDITPKNGELLVRLNDREYPARFIEEAEPKFSLLLGNRVIDLESEKKEGGYELNWRGKKFRAKVEEKRLAEIEKEIPTQILAAKELKSPLPGVVVKVEVQEGEQIQAGQGVLILEAMKMENEIKSPFSGTIKKILVKERETVEKDQKLVELA
jgi:pyruvate carboxylase subunit B